MTAAAAHDCSTTPLQVLIWHWGRRGGGPRYTLELTRALARRADMDVTLSLSRQSELFAESEGLGLPGIHIDTYTGGPSAALRSLALPMLARRFAAEVEAIGADLVLCTMRHLWNPWVASLLRRAGRRHVLVVHDAAPHPGDSHSGWDWLMRRNLDQADGLVMLTEHTRAQLLERYGYPADRTWVAPHGPLVFPGKRPDRPAPQRPRRLLFFGRMLPYKGLPLLLDAFRLVAESHDLELAVVGPGDLGSLAERLRAEPRVRLDNRWIPEDEIAGILAAADLVVLPYVEASQSGVVAAAYGLGRPVVATPVGGLREQVVPEVTGLIAAETTPQALADAIGRFCGDPALYARCVAGATAAGGMEASWDGIADQIADVLRQVRARPPYGRRAVPC